MYLLSQLTNDKFKTSYWQAVLPELYALKTVVENNSDHKQQNVFDHTLAVMTGVEQILQHDFLPNKTSQILLKYLELKVTNCTYLDLLRLAVVLHDVMKGQALVIDSKGKTRCPAHEILAVSQASKFQARFGLELSEVERVQKIVGHHGFTYDFLGLIMAKPELEATLLIEFISALGEVAVEVIVLSYADMLGSDLLRSNSVEFIARQKFYQNWLCKLPRLIRLVAE